MPLIHDSSHGTIFPQVKKKKYTGGSIGSIFSSVTDFLSNNQDLIKNAASAVGSIAGAASAINNARKSAEELNQIRAVIKEREERLKTKNKVEQEKHTQNKKIKMEEIVKNMPRGDGFAKISP